MSFFQQVYDVVQKIPSSKVMTYGDVAKVVGTKDARRVGQALHANRDAEMSCHRVVFADGRPAAGYVFGGEEKQRRKLEAEGVKFTDDGKVDLKECRAVFPIS